MASQSRHKLLELDCYRILNVAPVNERLIKWLSPAASAACQHLHVNSTTLNAMELMKVDTMWCTLLGMPAAVEATAAVSHYSF
jgi:uncharacterized membrane-anchored protein